MAIKTAFATDSTKSRSFANNTSLILFLPSLIKQNKDNHISKRDFPNKKNSFWQFRACELKPSQNNIEF